MTPRNSLWTSFQSGTWVEGTVTKSPFNKSGITKDVFMVGSVTTYEIELLHLMPRKAQGKQRDLCRKADQV